jgi:pimeloyl-ACP methyl ester carboxylesterase
MKKFIIIFLLYFQQTYAEEVNLVLKDNIEISGILKVINKEAPSVLLLHQCNRDQKMWIPYTKELNSLGFNTLTFDMRGYGESKKDGFVLTEDNYNETTVHQRNDILEINTFWRRKLPDSKFRVVIGASCGGAHSVKTLITNNDIKAMILLSPSLREHWIEKKYLAQYRNRKEIPIFVVASEDDKNAVNAINELFTPNISSVSQKRIYKGHVHGEPLFALDPTLIKNSLNWLQRTTKKDLIH